MISRYTQAVGNTLEEYIPIPFQEMMQAGQAIQQRGDLIDQQNAQVELGLGSLETMASGQTDFKNKFVEEYRNKAKDLMNRFPNPSDPEFIRESRKLNLQFTSDPRLQIIKQTNEHLKRQQILNQDLSSKGIKIIDPNRNFTGVDEKGNLIVPTSNLRGTMFDEDLTKAFLQIRDNTINDGKGTVSNKQNIENLAKSFINNIDTNPITRDAQDYYIQQGMSAEQAKQATLGLINQAYNDNLRTERDYQYDNYKLAERKFNYDIAKDKAVMRASQLPPQLPFQLLSFTKPILPGQENITRSASRTLISDYLKDLDNKGNLNAKTRRIPDTPANREAFGSRAKEVIRYSAEDRKLGINPIKELIVSEIDPQQVTMLKTARKLLGIKGGSAKEVFTMYDKLLSKYDNVANSVKSTTNVKINNALAEITRRQINSGEIYTVKNNKMTKVNFEDLNDDQIKELGNIKTDNISGISPKNFGILSGYTQFTDAKGNIFYTPLPQEYQQQFGGSKVIENYLQDFDFKNLKSVNINVGGINKEVFINPNQEALDYTYKGYRGLLKPYKVNENGNLNGGALFETNVDGKRVYLPLKISDIENNELTSVFVNLANHNNIEGN